MVVFYFTNISKGSLLYTNLLYYYAASNEASVANTAVVGVVPSVLT
jgi:hypothetical protein